MLLDLDKINPDAIAAKDSYGNSLGYGQIISLAETIEHKVPPRSLFFILTRNDIGGIAMVMSVILSGNVPLILSENTESRLLENLIDTYGPQFIVKPSDVPDETAITGHFGYAIESTGVAPCKMHTELSHLLPTSGSTGSPKLVRHKYDNIEAAGLNISTFFGLTASDRPYDRSALLEISQGGTGHKFYGSAV